MDVIVDLKKQGTSIIFSSHRMEHVEMFCEKLVVLVHGKSVLAGELKQIKKEYRKKNIHIEASNVDVNKLKEIEGVVAVTENENEIIVKIESDEDVNKVFAFIKICKDVTKFVVEDATLNEIFLDKVGVVYEN